MTYLHHYLPTLWFSVILCGMLLDHFIFKSRRWTQRTKTIMFALVSGSIVGTWWFFRATAWGIEGPASDMKWRKWRPVSTLRHVSTQLVGRLAEPLSLRWDAELEFVRLSVVRFSEAGRLAPRRQSGWEEESRCGRGGSRTSLSVDSDLVLHFTPRFVQCCCDAHPQALDAAPGAGHSPSRRLKKGGALNA